MSNKILSISVASYNVEKFIEQAIESYLDCNCKDKLEVLIVNDGSVDNTETIAKKYSEQYPDIIRIINQKNAGPGSTVNTGLKNANGKYFRMIDGDDWIKSDEMDTYIDFLEKNETDMVVTNFIEVDDKTGQQNKKNLKINIEYNKEYYFDDICNNLELNMHNITYKTSLIKNNLKLDNCFYTDTQYLLYPMKVVKTVAFLKNHIYMYRVSLDTQSVNIKSLQKHCDMHEMVLYELINFYKENSVGFCNTRKKYVSNRIAKMVGTQLYIYLSYNASEKYKTKIKTLLHILKNDSREIFNIIAKKKTIILLRISKYAMYKLISNKIRRKQ
ncbi:MAG: glycosyltransferase family 2 protein [Clostridiales bacterium]|nr:glycosyltransferase family 2 protein [Clostridiales bacterium]